MGKPGRGAAKSTRFLVGKSPAFLFGGSAFCHDLLESWEHQKPKCQKGESLGATRWVPIESVAACTASFNKSGRWTSIQT